MSSTTLKLWLKTLAFLLHSLQNRFDSLRNSPMSRISLILTIVEDDEEQSIGIDLNSNTGIRFAAGNELVWKREAKRDWDKFNFGIFGCWAMDEDGNLDYIPEENYTEEMWNEQKKLGMRIMQR